MEKHPKKIIKLRKKKKSFLNLTIGDILRNIVKSFVEIINELTNINPKKKNIYSENLYSNIFSIFQIFSKHGRGIYIGGFFILISFILFVFNVLWL